MGWQRIIFGLGLDLVQHICNNVQNFGRWIWHLNGTLRGKCAALMYDLIRIMQGPAAEKGTTNCAMMGGGGTWKLEAARVGYFNS